MEVNNNTRIDNSVLVANGINSTNSTTQQLEDTANFKDAAKVDITDPNGKIAQNRELSNETQQFLENKGVDLAKESANFDKQSVIAVAGSMTASQGHASAVNARALLS